MHNTASSTLHHLIIMPVPALLSSQQILLCFCLMIPGLSHAYLPLVTDDTGTQGQGGNQIELSFSRARERLEGMTDVTRELPVVFTRGLSEKLDLFAGLGWQRFSPVPPGTREHGRTNPVVGIKWRLLEDETRKLSLGIKPEVSLPLSRRQEEQGLGSAAFSYGATIMATKETGFGELHVNLAGRHADYELPENRSANRRNLWRISLAPVWKVNDQWRLAVDAGVMTNPDATRKRRMGFGLLGAVYAPHEDLELSVAGLRHIDDGPARTQQVTLGATWRFK